MALEGTHIRFAVDLKDGYHVVELGEYIAGAIYPDSRYIRKIDRQLTHPQDYTEWDIFKINDFKKGWLTHLLCDGLHLPLIKQKFPNLFLSKVIEQDSEDWVSLTAIKVLQDLDDVRKFTVDKYLPSSNLETAQNVKDRNLLLKYYKVNRELYASPKKLNLENYGVKLHKLGLHKDLADKVVKKAGELNQDRSVMRLILEIYPEMLSKALIFNKS